MKTLLFIFISTSMMGQIKGTLSDQSKIQASNGTNIFYIAPLHPTITSISKTTCIHYEPMRKDGLYTIISVLFNPLYPDNFTGNYMDIVKNIWCEYLQESEYDCWAIAHKVIPIAQSKYIEVRIVDDCGVNHDMTFKEFKKFIYE